LSADNPDKEKWLLAEKVARSWRATPEELLQQLEELRREDEGDGLIGVEYGLCSGWPEPLRVGQKDSGERRRGYVLVSPNRSALHQQAHQIRG